MSELPILYSFRRCPYAMRARMALWISGTTCELREVMLTDKPPELLAASLKGTVPVLVLRDGTAIEESIDIMRWSLGRDDPEGWLRGDERELLECIDGPFKHHLDRYKYSPRYGDCDPEPHRQAGLEFLCKLDSRLGESKYLCGDRRTLADIATFPFVRQFANHDRAWFDAQPIRRVQAWLGRHLASDLFGSVMGKHAPWKAGDRPVIFAS